MKFLGLLMINGENDVLETVVESHCEFVDAFYVLDGTVPNGESLAICESFEQCRGYITDAELPRPPFPEKPVCGYRQALLEMAVADYGCDNWFVVLHGDEVWTANPRLTVREEFDGYVYLLPFFFPRDGEPWDDKKHPLDQLRWHLGPGFPEFRLFRGGPNVAYDPCQTFNTRPNGIRNVALEPDPILHYLYRSPETQRARAAQHLETGFDPANYQHIAEQDQVYWTDEMIAAYQEKQWFPNLGCLQ